MQAFFSDFCTNISGKLLFQAKRERGNGSEYSGLPSVYGFGIVLQEVRNMTDQCRKPTEEQVVTITVRTRGDVCDLTDEQITAWYREHVDALLDPTIGRHEITVSVSRRVE